jgi:hypothetical protein
MGRGNKKLPDANENENTIYWNFWDITKTVITGKFIIMIAVKNQISNKLVMLLNILENQEQP